MFYRKKRPYKLLWCFPVVAGALLSVGMPMQCVAVPMLCRGLTGGSEASSESRLDWEALSEAELEIVRGIRACLGDAVFDTAPTDLLISFVRDCAHEADWLGAACARLIAAIAWRGEVSAENAVASPPPDRAEFERVYEAGPVGFDADGRPIILERLGKLSVATMNSQFNEQDLEAHAVYAMEAARALCRQASHRRGQRIYRAVWIVDAQGFGLEHFHLGSMVLFTRLARYYPEMVSHVYIINTTPLFNLFWVLARPLTKRLRKKERTIRATTFSLRPLHALLPAHQLARLATASPRKSSRWCDPALDFS